MKRQTKKNMVPTMVILLLFSGMIWSGIFICTDDVSASAIWTVNNQGGANFLRIQDAINASASGDMISVQFGSGTYSENIEVFIPDIMIQGVRDSSPPYDPPTVQARNSNRHCVEISAVHVRLETLKITGASSGGAAGVFTENMAADSSNWIEITQCEIYGNDYGVWIMGQSAYHLIDSSEVHDNEFDGINLVGSHHEIQNCEIYDNGGDGIDADSLDHSLIETSYVYSNGDNGIKILSANSNNMTIDEVDLTDNDDSGLILYGDGHTIDGRGTAVISNNHNAAWNGVSYDVKLVGYNIVIQNYEIYQDLINDVDYLIGVYSENVETTNHYGNTMDDCEVHGYDDVDCVGVQMDYNDYMDGIDTKIYNNNIGINANGEIDLHNYDLTSYNIYNNEIGTNIIGYEVTIHCVYYYYTGTSLDEIGIYADGTNNYYCTVYFCLIERLNKGIYLKNDDEYENDIHSTEINDCSYGIYIENGVEDLIHGNDISGCGCGIYLDTCSGTGISGNTLFDNNENGGLRCGIYSRSGSNIFLNDNTVTRHYIGVWFDDGVSGYLNDDIINDDGGISSDEWGENDVEIGVYITNMEGCAITGVHFEDLGYAIGVVATDNAYIYGDGEDMVDIEYYCLYATCDANHGSSGHFWEYGSSGSSYSVYLKGLSTDYTVYDYDDLQGNWTYVPGGYIPGHLKKYHNG